MVALPYYLVAIAGSYGTPCYHDVGRVSVGGL